MQPERKAAILASVASFLDEWEEAPEPLPGFAADADFELPTDLATLASAVAALARETQLQSKGIKRLGELLATLPVASRRDLEEDRDARRDAVLRDLIDVHDRLARCVREGEGALARRARIVALARFMGADRIARSLIDGVRLTLELTRDMLTRHDVVRFEAVGRPFDPACMRAVDTVASSAGEPSGLVIDCVRDGFLAGQHVLRPAEVRVAR